MVTKKGTNNNDMLKGADSDDMLLGRAGNDTLLGGDGNDRLDGGAGDDELLGGDGNDVLLPGKDGADAIDGGKGIDTVSYANFVPSAGIATTIQLNPIGELTYVDAAGDTFVNVERFIGTSNRDDFFFYRHDVPDGYYVFGGAGDDFMRIEGGTMRGGEGNDLLLGDGGDVYVDTFCLELNRGADTIQEFTSSQDKLQVSRKVFDVGRLLNTDELVNRASDASATEAKAQFIYRKDTDQLFYDSDGTGSEAAILVAEFGADTPGYLFVANFEIV